MPALNATAPVVDVDELPLLLLLLLLQALISSAAAAATAVAANVVRLFMPWNASCYSFTSGLRTGWSPGLRIERVAQPVTK
jgi:hypothetical protein